MIKLRYLIFILASASAHPLLAAEAIQSGAIGHAGSQCFITNASKDTVILNYVRIYDITGVVRSDSTTESPIACHKNMSLLPGKGCLTVAITSLIPLYCRVQYRGKAGALLGVMQDQQGHAITMVPVDYRAELSDLKPDPRETTGGEQAAQ